MLSFSQTTTINGIKVSCFCAGHVLGAALFMIEVDGVRVLYTGDFSSEKDRHLQSAEVPPGVVVLRNDFLFGLRVCLLFNCWLELFL